MSLTHTGDLIVNVEFVHSGVEICFMLPVSTSTVETRLNHRPDTPQLIRLYGDWSYRNLLNTSSELKCKVHHIYRASAVRRLFQHYGLIVLGYGGWDVTIMERIFQPLSKSKNALHHGVFWCHPEGTKLSPMVEEFLTSMPDRQAHLVEIDNFDNVMDEFATALISTNLQIYKNSKGNLALYGKEHHGSWA